MKLACDYLGINVACVRWRVRGLENNCRELFWWLKTKEREILLKRIIVENYCRHLYGFKMGLIGRMVLEWKMGELVEMILKGKLVI